ncbi:MAG: hypothetical protein KJ838_03165 [Candidatus Omnitrophica bacterium]|nr:hypothetical protein [Candidatus Omnitrophota bacterium]
MTNKCPKCGAKNLELTEYCVWCKEKLPLSQPENPIAKGQAEVAQKITLRKPTLKKEETPIKRPPGIAIFAYYGIILSLIFIVYEFFIYPLYQSNFQDYLRTFIIIFSILLSYNLLRLKNWSRIILLFRNALLIILTIIPFLIIKNIAAFTTPWHLVAESLRKAYPNLTLFMLIFGIINVIYLFSFNIYFMRLEIKKCFVNKGFRLPDFSSLIAVLILTILLNSSALPFQNTAVYRNRKFGFSFTMPREYELDKNDLYAKEEVGLVSFLNDSGRPFFVTVKPKTGSTRRSSWKERADLKSVFIKSGWKLASERIFPLSGEECYEFIIEKDAKYGQALRAEKIRYNDLNQALVSFSADAVDFDKLIPVFDDILESLKFKSN